MDFLRFLAIFSGKTHGIFRSDLLLVADGKSINDIHLRKARDCKLYPAVPEAPEAPEDEDPLDYL